MRHPAAMGIMVTALAATTAPALAQTTERPITNREPDIVDVAKTPMTDLNISRTEIPALLVEAEQRPYSLVNLNDCAQLVGAVEELDRILGPDLDLPQAERARFSTGRIAQWAVGTFIPFRSIIREVSGANRQQREIDAAIRAGLARRGFLKGVGIARNCPYPASPATETILAQHDAALKKADEDAKSGKAREGTAAIEPDPAVSTGEVDAAIRPARAPTVFSSEPVVQPTPRRSP